MRSLSCEQDLVKVLQESLSKSCNAGIKEKIARLFTQLCCRCKGASRSTSLLLCCYWSVGLKQSPSVCLACIYTQLSITSKNISEHMWLVSDCVFLAKETKKPVPVAMCLVSSVALDFFWLISGTSVIWFFVGSSESKLPSHLATSCLIQS